MATVATKPMTAEEFFELPEPPDGSRQELVNGKVITLPAPSFEHGRVQANLAGLLWQFARTTKLGTAITESGVITRRKRDSVRGPDVSFYSKKRAPLGRRVWKYNDQPPDLCVEVTSPSNTRKELRDKIREYFKAGVRMVWIVDPEDRSVTILTSSKEGRTLYEDSELDGGDILPGFTCKVSELFE